MSTSAECRRESHAGSETTRRVVQQWIVTLLKRSGPMTADEMASEMLESVLSVRPRVCELAAAGVIEETGETRPTASGRPQTVYRVKE